MKVAKKKAKYVYREKTKNVGKCKVSNFTKIRIARVKIMKK